MSADLPLEAWEQLEQAKLEEIEVLAKHAARLSSHLIATSHLLDVPFSNRPELSPWKRMLPYIHSARELANDATPALIAEVRRLRQVIGEVIDARDDAEDRLEEAQVEASRLRSDLQAVQAENEKLKREAVMAQYFATLPRESDV